MSAYQWPYLLLAALAVWNIARSIYIDERSTAPQQKLLDRPLIVYAYHESDDAYENAQFFIRNGVHGGADFLFFSQGEGSRLADLIPRDMPNVHFTERDNSCFDLGAYGIVLNEMIEPGIRRRDRYKHFILLNASLRGPILPYWAMNKTCWSERWLAPLSDDVKLVGLTYNCRPVLSFRPHVQSMIMALDNTSMEVLMGPGPGSLGHCYLDYGDAVANGETRLTERIGLAGYSDLTMAYATHQSPVWRKFCTSGDFNVHLGYFGFQLSPYEGMFVKSKRDIMGGEGYSELGLEDLTTWMKEMNYTSSAVCDKLYKPSL